MNYKLLKPNEEYELISLTEEYLQELFTWTIKEKHFEQYTCRPLKSPQSFDDYLYKTLKYISILLLEKFDFKLDGRLREHYWIDEDKYDQLNYSMLEVNGINKL